MDDRNRLLLGLFASNASSGIAATKAPARWQATWPDNVALAKLADDRGLDFLLPIARWKGYGGATNFEGSSFETITWAGGLLAHTLRLTVFGTVHAPLVHPVFAAKQFVTLDHVGAGRFGLNLVCGWNPDEFDMFGVQHRDHDRLYELGAEWIEIVKRLWESPAPFDYDGAFYTLKGVAGEPKPFGGTRPIIMNAGLSPVGRAFALQHCDCLFSGYSSLEEALAATTALHDRAAQLGRRVSVLTGAHVTCRPTRGEAQEYFRFCADEFADWEAVDNMIGINPRRRANYEAHPTRFSSGYGAIPFVGDPDSVAAEIAAIGEAGFRGLCLSFVNYLDELPYFLDEVVPRLERRGLRDVGR